MESQQVIVYSADVAAFVDALETIGYPVVETQASAIVDGEVVEALEDENVETYTIENSGILEQSLHEYDDRPRPKRFRINPKQQKDTIEKLFEKQKAVVTEKGFMNIKGNKRFKSDVWSWFGDIKLLISRSEAKKLKIPFYFRQCGDEQMMLSKSFVGCFRCSALFVHDAQRSGTSTLRAHMRVCSRPKPRKKKGAPTIIFFPNKPSSPPILDRVVNEDDKVLAHEALMNFILSTESSFDDVENPQLQKLLQMCISIGATYGDVNIESMLCPPEKLADFLLNDLHISSVNTFYTEFQHVYGASFQTDIWIDEQQKGLFISAICHYAMASGEIKSVVFHTDEFSCDVKTADDVKNWFMMLLSDMPVIPVKRLVVVDNDSKAVEAFKEEECVKCAYENLTLALNSVMDNVMQSTQADYADFASLIGGCKDIVLYFAQKGFEGLLPESLKLCKDENWASVVNMIRSIQSQFDEILHALNETGETHLLSLDKAVITAVIDLFEIFDTVLSELKNENEPTLNIVIPWITKLRKLCIPVHTDFPVIQQLKTNLVSEINERLTKNVTVYHRIATTLDPRFRRLVFLPREDQLTASNKLKALIKDCAESPIMEDFYESGRQSIDSCSKDRFSDLYSSNVSYDSGSPEKSVHRELDAYLSEPFSLANQDASQQLKFNPMKFWVQHMEKYPNLFRVALWILSCPASCIQTQQAESNIDWVVHKRRMHQKPDHINKTLFVKSFKKL